MLNFGMLEMPDILGNLSDQILFRGTEQILKNSEYPSEGRVPVCCMISETVKTANINFSPRLQKLMRQRQMF